MNPRLQACITLAYDAHANTPIVANRKRKRSGLPYIIHPFEVMCHVHRWLCVTKNVDLAKIDMLCAAILHDVLEDCPQVKPWDILCAGAGLLVQPEHELPGEVAMDGIRVHQLVCWLTNASKDSNAPRAERKRIDCEYIAKAPWQAKVIKAIDRTVNLRDMRREYVDGGDADFLRLYFDETRLLIDFGLEAGDVKLSAVAPDLYEDLNGIVAGP